MPQANSNDIGINAEKYLDALSDERLIDITEIAEYEWQCKSCSGYKNHSDLEFHHVKDVPANMPQRQTTGTKEGHLVHRLLMQAIQA